ncbi:hypothetical protein U8591_11025, partial [Aquirufa antheringensis]
CDNDNSLTFFFNAVLRTNDTEFIGTRLDPYLRFKSCSSSSTISASTLKESVLSKRFGAVLGGGGML